MIILGIYLINQIRTGGDRDYLKLLEELAQRGNRVFVIFNSYLSYTPLYFTPINLPVKYKRHHFPPASYLFKKNIKKYFSKILNIFLKEDISEINFIHINGDIYLKSAIFLKKHLSAPLFYASRCDDIDRLYILRRYGALDPKEYLSSFPINIINHFREFQIAKYADMVAFINTYDKSRFMLRRKYAEDKIVLIPNHIGPPRCTDEYKNQNNSSVVKNLVYVGSLSASKGLWDLLKALSALINKGYDFLHCYILGRMENMKKTLKLIEKYKLKDFISIEGYKSPFPYFVSCDLFINPTLYDSFSNVTAEALHTGCPVIASAVGGIPDLLKYSELLFESGNIEEIVSKIERCITDNSFYQHIRSLCSERATVYRFDWAGHFEEVMSTYMSIHNNTSRKIFTFKKINLNE
jgi:glycosyltransferase involved in cell wall biosynthesis